MPVKETRQLCLVNKQNIQFPRSALFFPSIFLVNSMHFPSIHSFSDLPISLIDLIITNKWSKTETNAVVINSENGRLSYENPNYQLHLNAVRLEDALNSNTEHFNLNSALLGLNMDVLSPQITNGMVSQSY